MNLFSEGANPAQMSEAEKVLAILCQAYPGHPWAVRVDEGIIFIRHLELGNGWGMNIKTREVDHDAAVLKRKVILYAGEWLERAGLKRGRENGDEIIRVEGLPDKYQPPGQKPALSAEAYAHNEQLRTKLHPQVIRG